MAGAALRILRVVGGADQDSSLITAEARERGVDTLVLDTAGVAGRRCRTRAQTDACTQHSGRGRRDETDGLTSGSVIYLMGAPTCGVSIFTGSISERLRVARCVRACDGSYLREFFRQRLSHLRIALSDPIKPSVDAAGCGAAQCDDGSVLGALRRLGASGAIDLGAQSLLHADDVCPLLGQPNSPSSRLAPLRTGLRTKGLGSFLRGPRHNEHAHAHSEWTETVADPPDETKRVAEEMGPDAQASWRLPRIASLSALHDLLYERLQAAGALDFRPDGVVAKWSEQTAASMLAQSLAHRVSGGGLYDVCIYGHAHVHDFASVPVRHNANVYLVYIGTLVHEGPLQRFINAGKTWWGAGLQTDEELAALEGTPDDTAAAGILRRQRAAVQDARKVLDWCRESETSLDANDTREALEALLNNVEDEADDKTKQARWAREAAEEEFGPKPASQERTMLCNLRPQEWCFCDGPPPLRRGRLAREVIVSGFKLGSLCDTKATGNGKLIEIVVDISYVNGDALSRRYEREADVMVPTEVREVVMREAREAAAAGGVVAV